jgi:hypothetical protein
MRSSIIVLFAFVGVGLALPNPLSCPINGPVNGFVNGEIVGTCDDKTELGLLSCNGTGFITCTHRGNIFRLCGPGTSCTEISGQVVCE